MSYLPPVMGDETRTPREVQDGAVVGVVCLILWVAMVAGIVIGLGVGW